MVRSGTRAGPNPMSHMPRPWVAIRSVRDCGGISAANTATTGNPAPKGDQVAPPSVEAYTPISVPANNALLLAGSTAKAFTGTSGRPVLIPVTTGAVLRLDTFHTCDWLVEVPPK